MGASLARTSRAKTSCRCSRGCLACRRSTPPWTNANIFIQWGGRVFETKAAQIMRRITSACHLFLRDNFPKRPTFILVQVTLTREKEYTSSWGCRFVFPISSADLSWISLVSEGDQYWSGQAEVLWWQIALWLSILDLPFEIGNWKQFKFYETKVSSKTSWMQRSTCALLTCWSPSSTVASPPF